MAGKRKGKELPRSLTGWAAGGRFSGPKDHVLAEIPPETKNDRIPPSRPLIVE